jgi:DNA-binding GntR family transcriptional regulator
VRHAGSEKEQATIVIPAGQTTLEGLANEARRSYRTVEDMVHEVIREAIVTGVYQPGDRLPQDSIAESIGVSRIPVRAALRSLEAEGFVILEPHKGATVRALSKAEIAEIYELRALLETYAVRAVAEKITSDELEEVAALSRAMDDTDDTDAWDEARRAFYGRLYDIAERPHTAELIRRLRADVGRYWKLRRISEDHDHGHDVIVKALSEGRPDDAAAWLRSHFTELSVKLQSLVGPKPPG